MGNMLLSLFPVLLAPGLWAAEFPLLKDGKAVSQMIVAEDAPLPVQYAARELAKYLAKISAGETPSIAPVKNENLHPVFCIVPPPPDAEVYNPLRRGPISEHNLNWAAMWQTNYLSAQFMFDIHQDFDQFYEECKRLYYGKGWDGGMKEFRALLGKAFRETPGCMGWGLGAPLGRCLDQPGVQNQLKALLVRADEAAAGDPDPRARMHVRRERDIFAYTWEAARKTYLENDKELNAYRRTSPITIDGELSEQDWKTADVMTGFKHPPWPHTEPEPVPTYFRAIYEPDSFYLAVAAMEPAPGKYRGSLA